VVLYETSNHSFIIKVWLEEPGTKTKKATWRGCIIHMPSGKEKYIKDLNETILFMIPQLKKIGAKIPLQWKIIAWLNLRFRRANLS
jgi:hypothetical protein